MRTTSAADRAYPFLIFREADQALIGGVTLANVRRGIVQAGTVGYWVGAAVCGARLHDARAAVLLPYIFSELSLHRDRGRLYPDQ